MTTSSASERVFTAAGASIVALSATPWLSLSVATEAGDADRTVSLWAMLGVVRESILPLAVAAVLIIVGFGVACAIWRPGTASAAAGLAAFAWLAAATSALVMAFTDGGFEPGTGAWVTLVVAALTAIVATVHAATLARAGRPVDQRR